MSVLRFRAFSKCNISWAKIVIPELFDREPLSSPHRSSAGGTPPGIKIPYQEIMLMTIRYVRFPWKQSCEALWQNILLIVTLKILKRQSFYLWHKHAPVATQRRCSRIGAHPPVVKKPSLCLVTILYSRSQKSICFFFSLRLLFLFLSLYVA